VDDLEFSEILSSPLHCRDLWADVTIQRALAVIAIQTCRGGSETAWLRT